MQYTVSTNKNIFFDICFIIIFRVCLHETTTKMSDDPNNEGIDVHALGYDEEKIAEARRLRDEKNARLAAADMEGIDVHALGYDEARCDEARRIRDEKRAYDLANPQDNEDIDVHGLGYDEVKIAEARRLRDEKRAADKAAAEA